MPNGDIERLGRDIELLGRDFPRPVEAPRIDLPTKLLLTAAVRDSEKGIGAEAGAAKKEEARAALDEAKTRAKIAALELAAAAGRTATGKIERKKEDIGEGIRKRWELEKSGAGYVFWALVLLILDLYTRWFGGLDVEAMMKNLSSVMYIISNSVINAVVLIPLLMYFIMRWEKVTKQEFVSFFVFIEVAYLCLTLGGVTAGVVVHILFAIYTWFVLKGDLEDPSAPSKWVAFLLFLDFFGVGFMGWAGAKYGIEVLSVLGNRVGFPIYLLFSLLYTSTRYRGKRPFWLTAAVTFMVIIYVFAFIGESYAYADFAQGLSQKDIKAGKSIIYKSFDNMKKFGLEVAYSLSTGTGGWWDRLIIQATGGYGRPEETERVGIFLEIEEPEAEVPTKTSFYAEVSAETLGTIESVPVSVKCWWGEDYEEENEGIITPSEKRLFDGESETFRCKFYEKELDPEADEISFEASASGLLSTGELPVFFIDEELRRLMKKRGEDLFFGFYEGKSVNPIVTYTNGPLAIKTTALNQPIGIGEEDVEKVFGIMLSNAWDKGEISSVNSLVVKLPKGVELSNCDEEFTLETTGTHNIYSFDTSEFVSLKDIDDEAFFLCDMTIRVSEKNDLIVGALKTHPRHVYINAEYDFKTKDSISIDVIGKEDEGNGGGEKPSQYVKPTNKEIDDYLQSKGAPWAGQGQCMVDASERTGIPLILMLALPKKEGDWGGSELQTGNCPPYCIDDRGDTYTNPQDKKAYNLFSIKGSGCWWSTKEIINDKEVMVCAAFKNYDGYCDSINDFANIVSTSSLYSEAMQHKDDPEEMVKDMLIAGWATDSDWADSVINIMRIINSEMS